MNEGALNNSQTIKRKMTGGLGRVSPSNINIQVGQSIITFQVQQEGIEDFKLFKMFDDLVQLK